MEGTLRWALSKIALESTRKRDIPNSEHKLPQISALIITDVMCRVTKIFIVTIMAITVRRCFNYPIYHFSVVYAHWSEYIHSTNSLSPHCAYNHDEGERNFPLRKAWNTFLWEKYSGKSSASFRRIAHVKPHGMEIVTELRSVAVFHKTSPLT